MAQPGQVKRYRPGKVPEYAKQAESASSCQLSLHPGKYIPEISLAAPEIKPSYTVVEDRRLARLQQVQVSIEPEEERVRRRVRTVEAAEIIEPEILEQPKQRVITMPELIEDDVISRAERLQKAKQRQIKEEEEELPVSEEDEDEFSDEDEDSSDEGTSSSSDDGWGMGSRPAIQPRFISKEKRQSIKTEEDYELEEQQLKEEKERRKEEQKERVLQQLREFKEREQEEQDMKARDEIDVDTEDEAGEEQEREIEMWKLRELQRIKRDREQREAARLEKAQIEARRGMTDEEVMEEKMKLGDGVKEKRQIRFLQKYYHKGAFFADELADVHKAHDWLAPVGEDAEVDRELLPSVLQVKNFGRSGRTKYTHLTNEDTSAKDSLWATTPGAAERLGQNFGAGFGSTDRPAVKKRRLEGDER